MDYDFPLLWCVNWMMYPLLFSSKFKPTSTNLSQLIHHKHFSKVKKSQTKRPNLAPNFQPRNPEIGNPKERRTKKERKRRTEARPTRSGSWIAKTRTTRTWWGRSKLRGITRRTNPSYGSSHSPPPGEGTFGPAALILLPFPLLLLLLRLFFSSPPAISFPFRRRRRRGRPDLAFCHSPNTNKPKQTNTK